MRQALFVTAAIAAFVLLALSCGGSSSETPWPIEPAPAVLAPPSELSPASSLIDEDAGAKRRKE